ncbi:hypothetical protein J7E96_19385 [Streptomyces sp. ISL-96]|uniref:hypothetical protein n=1 Tax=Streptomyces sp. ISL-96 TaxID=2819191 RepID=UPI001BE960F9|nr:hypothetical protein [Streptomyces sp. ISL-96]MBT2490638.1 hypothetical protein [Streptomyces sp. ISL-96]
MPCSCTNKNRQQWEVVVPGQARPVFTSASKPTAQTVAKRYPGSEVRETAPAAKVG